MTSTPTLDRTTYVGGSDIGAIVGCSPYRTALDVWGTKVLGAESMVTPAMEAGTYLEEGIVHLYQRRRGGDPLPLTGTLRDPAEPWIGATPDRVFARGDSRRNVQCKLVGFGAASRWGDAEDGPDGVPTEVLCQVAWEAHVLAAHGIHCDVSDVAALIGTDLRIYEVPTDEEFFDALRRIASVFWHEHVQTRRPPELTAENAESARAVLAARWPRQTAPLAEATPDLSQLAREYDAARVVFDDARRTKDLIAARLQLAIGPAEGFAGHGVKVTWRAQHRDSYVVQASNSRVLRVTIRDDI